MVVTRCFRVDEAFAVIYHLSVEVNIPVVKEKKVYIIIKNPQNRY